jgi:TRAP transporter 4TM/12TM fusion protein
MAHEPVKSNTKLHQITSLALPIVAVTMAIYQLVYTQYLLQIPTAHQITHLGFALVVVLLFLIRGSKKSFDKGLKFVLLISSLVVTGFFMTLLDEILTYRSAMPETIDLAIGVLELILIFVTSYLIYGRTFPILGVIFIAYVYFGRYLPYPMTVADVPIDRILMWLSSVGIDEGAYGEILAISANYLFLFIFFGALLDVFGGTRFVISLGHWVGSKLKSGPAAVAVIGSSLLGTITGSTVANITITGSFTIPMMKKSGYTPEQAGAIETVSSSGGQIMPPIMGATAFVMSGYSGIPYIHIVMAAIVPALIYYFGVFVYVQLTATKMNIVADMKPVSGRKLLLDAPIFLVPLGVLVFLLAKGFSLPFVSFWTMMTLIAIGLLSGFLRKDIDLNFRRILEGIVNGTIVASETAIVCAMIGVVATCIKVSGLGIKLPNIIADVSHGYLIIALLIAMVSSVLLGMGVPTPVAYILVAIGAVPALKEMGVSTLQAHLFCFICAVFSHITPPVAIGALVAAQIANADYWKTAWESVKAAFAKYLLPFLIVYAPVIILRPKGGIISSTIIIIALILAILSLQMYLSSYGLIPLTRFERPFFIITTLVCLTGVFAAVQTITLAGIVIFGIITSLHMIRKTQLKVSLSAEN